MQRVLLKDEITDAIRDGFGHNACRVEIRHDRNFVYVEGHETPITVLKDDVIIPTSLGNAAAGIRLDVQAILAERKAK